MRRELWFAGIIMIIAMMIISTDALAFTIDSSKTDQFGYELYSFFFDTVLGGFIGFVAMAGISIMGILQLTKGRWEVMLLSAAVVISIAKLDSILKSLGCTLNDIGVISNIGYLIW